jgi:hypothetical protein
VVFSGAVVGQELIGGVIYEVSVDYRTGDFGAIVDGEAITAATKDDLIKRLTAVSKQPMKRIAIRATLSDWRGLTPITIIGRHNGNKNILYRIDGERATLQMSGRNTVLRDMSATERGEYDRLTIAAKDADRAVELWIDSHGIDYEWMVEQALAADAVDPHVTDSGKPSTRDGRS